jgi:hypothetical protein
LAGYAKKYSQLIFSLSFGITIKIQHMIAYDRYTELLSKHINRTITAQEMADVEKYEASQPKTCPKCGAAVWTFLEPFRVAHYVDKCTGKGSV